jgi:hypothetical protein
METNGIIILVVLALLIFLVVNKPAIISKGSVDPAKSIDCSLDDSCEIEPPPKPVKTIPQPVTADDHDDNEIDKHFQNTVNTNNKGHVIAKPQPIKAETKASDAVAFDVNTKVNEDVLNKKEDKLKADDLLPSTDNEWSRLNTFSKPDTQNYLTSDNIGRVGVNTVGGTLRNPVYDIRGVPPVTSMKIPFQNSTIESDTNLKWFQIVGN